MGGKPKDEFYSIRIPDKLKMQAKIEAKQEGISFNRLALNAIESYLKLKRRNDKERSKENSQ